MKPLMNLIFAAVATCLLLYACNEKESNLSSPAPDAEMADSMLNQLVKLAYSAPDSSRQLMLQYIGNNPFPTDSNFYYRLMKLYGGLIYNYGKIDSTRYYLHQSLRYWERQADEKAKFTECTILNNLAYMYAKESKNDSALL